MSLIIKIVILTAVVGVAGTGFGGFVGSVINWKSYQLVNYLLAFACGISLSVVFFDLIPEALEPDGATEKMPLYLVIIGMAAGFLIVYVLNSIIERQVGHSHPTGEEECSCPQCNQGAAMQNTQSLLSAGIIMTVAIGLHNLPAGIVIGASYAEHAGNFFANSGFILAMVILLHNIPEGMTVSLPLISGGMKSSKGIALAAVAGVPIIIGAVIGYYVGIINPLVLCLTLSFAAGAMLYVVFAELLPEVFSVIESKVPAIFIFAGMALGYFLVNLEG